MNKKRKHQTTKNTVTKPPVTKLMVIRVECNGVFDLVTDFKTQDEFDKIFKKWVDHPDTFMWCAESLIAYIKIKHPSRICLLEEDYKTIIKDFDREGIHVIPATKEEWESENN